MSRSENPYQSPSVPDPAQPEASPPVDGKRHGWKFVLLGVAIACGIFSMAPWLGVIFSVLSAPVFLRYFFYGRRRPNATPGEVAASQAAGALGSIGFALSVTAAVGGAFFGTCNVVGWSIAFAMPQSVHYVQVIQAALTLGTVAGFSAALTALIWLVRFYYPTSRG